MSRTVRTTCNRDCPDACGIVAEVEDGRVLRIGGDREHPVTRGFLCERTSRFLERQYDPDRVTTPLLRRDGAFAPIGWDEALDFAADRMLAFRGESGPASIFHYRSGGSLGLLKHLCDYFFERFGPVTVKRGDICSGAGDLAQETDFGLEDSNDLFDLRNSRTIVLWGKNVFVSNVHVLPLLREAKARGARLLFVDPVWNRTATLCDRVLRPRPGGDFALAMGTARVLMEEGRIDPEAPTYCDHFEALRTLVFSRPLEAWAREADVGTEEVAGFARDYAEGPAAILVGWGLQRRANGSATIRALDALGAISGNLGVPGGGVSFYFRRRGAFDTSFIRGLRAAPRSICEPLLGPEVLAADDPRIRMVWVTAGNPVAMLPESETVARALETREFVVVVDSFLTDTARCAHLVLPTTTLLEDDDLVGAYGHHLLGSVRPVVPPPRGVRSDLEILQGLAARVGLAEAMEGSARDWKRRFLHSAEREGATLEAIEGGYVRNPFAPKVLFEGRRFPTPSGRVNLIHHLPPEVPPPTSGFPLFLTSVSTEKAQASQTTAKFQRGPADAIVHPEAAPGIRDGELARLETILGSMTVRLRLDPRQRRDVVVIPKGGWRSAGRCANALVRARPTDAGEGAAYYDEHARVAPLR
ncbi:MAG TPA: molybdopterin-dependent oxidoreductase [Planctomycetota bacterium]|nr:molybdopterin-dependent oxidoreductase [Planctomycetota bacterium]